jgi:hypothetical protein
MKLNIVPAKTGVQWVRQGMQTFWRQPLALSGLFFMFMAVMSISSLLPVVGSVLALMLLPAATLGLMAAAREASLGKFPLPTVLVSAWRAGQQRKREMVILGMLYAGGFLGIMGLSSLFDGGTFARLYLVGGTFTRETVLDSGFQTAMWVSTLLYLPLSALFWHAPALVHWHSQPAVKSVFFSLVACLGNWRAIGVYLLTWCGVLATVSLGILLVASLADSAEIASVLLLPLMLLMAAMFFTSSYFTFRDSFVNDPILA